MSRRSVTLKLEPVPEKYAEVYRRRGMSVPAAHSGHIPAAAWPYHPRGLHRLVAALGGYFWLPCVLCGEPHGGNMHSGLIYGKRPRVKRIWWDRKGRAVTFSDSAAGVSG